jgi:hypothetical protein
MHGCRTSTELNWNWNDTAFSVQTLNVKFNDDPSKGSIEFLYMY